MGTVLLADDHELVRETIAAFLRQNGGHEVVSVGSFSEVESAIRDLTFNLILLDYRMPGMAALDGVRTVVATVPGVPVALISGAASPEVARQAMELGAHGFLPKTLAPAELVDAVDILMSGKAKAAFELDREDKKTREKYGPGWGEQALLCRRLIEAGARFVSLNTGYWDDHGNLKGALDNKMPRHDRAVGVLIEDLAQRGMLENTLVVTAGEFGRTPKINGNAGRDHWPQAQSILVAGGGYRGGQVIGTTDKDAAPPTSRKVDVADFCRIVYRGIGMTGDEEIVDPGGRPVHLVYGGKVPRELI